MEKLIKMQILSKFRGRNAELHLGETEDAALAAGRMEKIEKKVRAWSEETTMESEKLCVCK